MFFDADDMDKFADEGAMEDDLDGKCAILTIPTITIVNILTTVVIVTAQTTITMLSVLEVRKQ